MKKYFFIPFFMFSIFAVAQNFDGKGDQKLQIGANLQDNASGIMISYDHGLGQNISVGLVTGYALDVNDLVDADFVDRINLRARFNANIGEVLNIDENLDIYPGIGLSLKNFGGHLGFRYFLSDGFGIYTEFETPFAKYKTGDLNPAESINNQFAVSFGAVFNL